jgi:hypothetical protein
MQKRGVNATELIHSRGSFVVSIEPRPVCSRMSRRQAIVFDNAAAFEFLHAAVAWTEAALLKRVMAVTRVEPSKRTAIGMFV